MRCRHYDLGIAEVQPPRRIRRRVAVTVLTIATLSAGLILIRPGGVEPGIAEHRVPRTLTFQGDRLTTLQWASDEAARCGGVLLIDTDDREILIGSCDQ